MKHLHAIQAHGVCDPMFLFSVFLFSVDEKPYQNICDENSFLERGRKRLGLNTWVNKRVTSEVSWVKHLVSNLVNDELFGFELAGNSTASLFTPPAIADAEAEREVKLKRSKALPSVARYYSILRLPADSHLTKGAWCCKWEVVRPLSPWRLILWLQSEAERACSA